MGHKIVARRQGLPKGKVLVLGERGTSELIARHLHSEGFEPVFQYDDPNFLTSPFLLPSQPGALNQLRELLARFIHQIQSSIDPSQPELKKGWVHPGATLWAERPELASVCHQLGLMFLGPSVKTLSLLGDRLSFLMSAEKLGVFNVVQTLEPLHSLREVEEYLFHRGISFPLVLKSVKGSGRPGVLFVSDLEALRESLPFWLDQLRERAGEALFFIEKAVLGARLVTVPFARFRDGLIHVFPLLDASLQWGGRKQIEFCPALSIEDPVVRMLENWTSRLAELSEYTGVGAFEFLVEGDRAFLIDVIPRLNTSFHLWERVAQTSAIAWQLACLDTAAAHFTPSTLDVAAERVGLVLRISAEDPIRRFPQAGYIQEASENKLWTFQSIHSEAEWVLSSEEGQSLSIQGSGTLGYLFVFAPSQSQCLLIARGLLNELWFAGSLQSNESFLLEVLSHPWVREGSFHAGFLEQEFVPSFTPSLDEVRLAAQVSLLCREGLHHLNPLNPLSSLPPLLKWSSGVESGGLRSEDLGLLESNQTSHKLTWIEGPDYWTTGGQKKGISGKVQTGAGESVRVCVYPLADRWNVRIGIWFVTLREPGIPISQLKESALKFPSLVNGRVHSIRFRQGAIVPSREPLLIIEAFGLYVPHALPIETRVCEWKVKAGDLVQIGQELLTYRRRS